MMNSSSKIMTFMTPGLGVLVLGRGSYDYIVKKKHQFILWKTPLLLNIKQMNYKYIVRMRKNASSKIVQPIAPGLGQGFWC